MTRRYARWALPLAALLLAGCSAAAPQPTPAASEPHAADGTLSAAQVQDVARQLLGDDPSLSVVGNEVMQRQLQAAKDAKNAGGISPQRCAEQMEKYTVTDLTGSVAATASVTDEKLGKVVQVFSLTDPATRERVAQALTLSDLSGCEEVTVEQSGKKLSAQRQILPLTVDAERSLTMSTQLDAGGGQKLSSVVVQALDGPNFVIVTFQTGLAEPATLSSEAVELANKAFDTINSLE